METPRLQPRRPSWLPPSAADVATAARAEPLSRVPSGSGGSPLRLSTASAASSAASPYGGGPGYAPAPWPAPPHAAPSPHAAGGVVYLSGGALAAPSAPPLSAWAAEAPTPVAFGRERSGSGGAALALGVPGSAAGAAAWDAVARRVEALGSRLEAVRRVRAAVSFAPQPGLAQPPPAAVATTPSAPLSPLWASVQSAPQPLPAPASPLAPHLAGALSPPRAAAASAPTAPPLPASPAEAAAASAADVAPPSDAECDAAAARAEAAFQAALATAQRVVAKVAGHVETALTPPRAAASPARRASAASA